MERKKQMVNDADQKKNFANRPPVAVILGHVDSGKTSLLDYIRKSSVAAGESGGITQHIGAYQVEKDGKKITFIDTPGHEAFSAMRMRGAKVADVAVLVVDGMAGVQQQTKEAISHIKTAGIPFIVAINKIDVPGVIPEKIKTELIKADVLVESMGGQVPSVNVSAKTGQGVGDLLEMILLLGEVENLKGSFSKPAEGVVIESFLDAKRGPVATVIISNGVIGVGDVAGTPSVFGKVKSLENFQGSQVQTANPSDPIVVIGLPQVPKVGEVLKVFPDMESAEDYLEVEDKKAFIKNPEAEEGQKILNLILKYDVEGSAEAIMEILRDIPQDKIILNIIKSGVGEVNESDVKLARSARATVFGFRVKINNVARQMAERDKVKIINFDIIYELVEGIRKFMERVLSPEDVRTDIGKVKILAVFMVDKSRQIVGGRVSFGEVKRGALIEVTRNEEILGKGRMINLQKNKKDADRVTRGEECGILFEGGVKIETGDVLVIYTETKVKAEL